MIDLTALTPWQFMLGLGIVFLAALGAFTLCAALLVGFLSSRTPRAVLEPDPPTGVMAPLGDEPEPVVVEPAKEPEPTPEPVVVAPTEIVVIEKRLPDLLPLPEPRRDEVPIYAQVPVRLPQYDSIDWRFGWKRPAVDFPTGSFPVVVLSDDIEGYQVSEVPAVPMPGFEVDPNTRGRFVRSDAELAAQAAALGFGAKEPKKHYGVVDSALAEVAERLGKAKAKADAEVSA